MRKSTVNSCQGKYTHIKSVHGEKKRLIDNLAKHRTTRYISSRSIYCLLLAFSYSLISIPCMHCRPGGRFVVSQRVLCIPPSLSLFLSFLNQQQSDSDSDSNSDSSHRQQPTQRLERQRATATATARFQVIGKVSAPKRERRRKEVGVGATNAVGAASGEAVKGAAIPPSLPPGLT